MCFLIPQVTPPGVQPVDRSGSVDIVQEFIRVGLSVKATDAAGWTPLHVAVFMGRRTAAVQLLEHGAELHVQNERGQTAVDLCSDTWLREALCACAQ